MALKSQLVAQVITKTGDEYERGTAYPIGDNIILTARHVVPNLDQYQETIVQWKRDDQLEKEAVKYPLEQILYESEQYDLLVACCKVPKETSLVHLSQNFPSSQDNWDSCGYSRSGKDHNKRHRFKDPAKGGFIFAKEDDFIQQLEVKGNVTEAKLWRGMSGAPVFMADQNELVAVIIETPRKDKNGNDVYKDRLYATSIPYVLEHDEDFRQAVGLDKKSKYCDEQQKRLTEHLVAIKKDHPVFYTKLADTFPKPNKETLDKAMIAALKKNREKCVEHLRICCSPYIEQGVRVESELLLVLLLGYLHCEEPHFTKHFHDLNVRTKVLTELLLASRYRLPPAFEQKGTAGKYVLDSELALAETGFDATTQAIELAQTIAYRLYKKFETDEPLSEDEMDDDEWDGISEEIRSRRGEDFKELHRFEIANNNKKHPLLNEDVRTELHKLLPELPLVIFGKRAGQANETRLQKQVKLFYEKLNPIG